MYKILKFCMMTYGWRHIRILQINCIKRKITTWLRRKVLEFVKI